MILSAGFIHPEMFAADKLHKTKETTIRVANDMYCIINIHHDTNLGWLSADMGVYGKIEMQKKGSKSA